MTSVRRGLVVNEYSDVLIEQLEKTVESSDSKIHWRVLAASVIKYWLEKFYDDASGRAIALEQLVESIRAKNAELRMANAQLKLRVRELEREISKKSGISGR